MRKPISIISWNVNSIKARLPNVLQFLRHAAPDIVLFQELKCIDEQFPAMEIEDLGYNISTCGQKTYNGVAIISKFPLSDVRRNLPGDSNDTQARYIEAIANAHTPIRVASIYVPNGQSPDAEAFKYKLAFLERLHAHAKNLLTYQEELVLGGDYNIAPAAIDVFNPQILEGQICFHPEEKKSFRRLINLGLTDAFRAIHPQAQNFSWWDYRAGSWDHNKGMRIDHFLISPEAADKLKDSRIISEERGREKASDHAPVAIFLEQ
jgi:exodeoxyribonuclease-3